MDFTPDYSPIKRSQQNYLRGAMIFLVRTKSMNISKHKTYINFSIVEKREKKLQKKLRLITASK